MLKIALLMLISINLFAEIELYVTKKNSIGITGLANSHHKNRNMNESHKWKGIKYTRIFNEDLSFGLEYSNFINSYSKETNSIGINTTWMPIHIGNFSMGPNLFMGVQKGYCFDGLFKTITCTDNESNKTPLIIPSLEFQYSFKNFDIGLNLSTNGDDYFSRFYLNLFKW